MKAIFPSSDMRQHPNISEYFTVRNGMVAEVVARGLSENHVVRFERQLEADACGGQEVWHKYFDMCCGEAEIAEACHSYIFNLSGTYRAYIMDTVLNVGVTRNDIGSTNLVLIEHEDVTGALASRYPCCK